MVPFPQKQVGPRHTATDFVLGHVVAEQSGRVEAAVFQFQGRVSRNCFQEREPAAGVDDQLCATRPASTIAAGPVARPPPRVVVEHPPGGKLEALASAGVNGSISISASFPASGLPFSIGSPSDRQNQQVIGLSKRSALNRGFDQFANVVALGIGEDQGRTLLGGDPRGEGRQPAVGRVGRDQRPHRAAPGLKLQRRRERSFLVGEPAEAHVGQSLALPRDAPHGQNFTRLPDRQPVAQFGFVLVRMPYEQRGVGRARQSRGLQQQRRAAGTPRRPALGTAPARGRPAGRCGIRSRNV